MMLLELEQALAKLRDLGAPDDLELILVDFWDADKPSEVRDGGIAYRTPEGDLFRLM